MVFREFWDWLTGRDILLEQIKQLEAAKAELQAKYDTDTKYYDDRIKLLQDLLNRSLTPLELKQFLPNVKITNPRNLVRVIDYAQADENYYSLDLGEWVPILNGVSHGIKATWTNEVFDCDDFALLMSGLLAYSVFTSGFDKQLAFGIAWSDTHAYNLFVDKNDVVWVYEPQNNSVIGTLFDAPEPYKTKEAWFQS